LPRQKCTLGFEKRFVDRRENEFLLLGQGHHAGEVEAVLGVAEVNLVHGAQLQQGTFGGEISFAQAILEQRQKKISQIAEKDMRVNTLCEPMADGTQLRDALETAKGLFDEILVEVQRKHFVLGKQAGAEDAGVTIEFFGLGQLDGQQVAARIEELLQCRFNAFALGQ